MKLILFILVVLSVDAAADTYVLSGAKTSAGAKTRFVGAASAPSESGNPSPADGATRQALATTLQWSNATGATAYDVWAGSTAGSLAKVSSAQAGTSYPLTNVVYGQEVHWRIDPLNGIGTTTGDVWSFTIVTPFTAQAFIDFEDGSDDDLLTTNHLDAVTVGSLGVWTFDQGANSDAMFIDASQTLSLSTPATVDGDTYLGGGTRVLRIDNSKHTNSAVLTFTAPHDDVTVGMLIMYGSNNYGPGAYRGIDLITLVGDNDGDPNNAVAQQSNASTPTIIVHTSEGGGSSGITVSLATWYWLELKFAAGDKAYLALYNPSTRAQVGVTRELIIGTTQCVQFAFGPRDAHSGEPASFTYLDNIVISTSGTFPLGP